MVAWLSLDGISVSIEKYPQAENSEIEKTRKTVHQPKPHLVQTQWAL